jgi:Bax protein
MTRALTMAALRYPQSAVLALSAGLLALFLLPPLPALVPTPAALRFVAAEADPDPLAARGWRDADLADVRRGNAAVPAVLLPQLPRALPALDPAARPTLFLRALLPVVLDVNETIAASREHLLWMRGRLALGRALLLANREWLRRLARHYGVTAAADTALIEALLPRVDIVPPSLALGQAALESGWGASRIAQIGNALFGQRSWDPEAGMVPRVRPQDPGYARFADLHAAVAAYMHNLNTHPAYAGFRALRAQQRRDGVALDGHALAGGLQAYAEIPDYVPRVRRVVSEHDLVAFDQAQLHRGWWQLPVLWRGWP